MLALLCALTLPALPAPSFEPPLPAPAFAAGKRCPVRGASCPCGCRDGEACTCAAAKRRGGCGDAGCRCRNCGDYCSCGVFGPCSGGCLCPPDRPEWHEMEAGGLGLYRKPAYGSDWVLFGYWDGTHYWNYLRHGKGWGPPRESPPVDPPKPRQGRKVPPPAAAPTFIPGASLPSLTFPPAWAPARPADC